MDCSTGIVIIYNINLKKYIYLHYNIMSIKNVSFSFERSTK